MTDEELDEEIGSEGYEILKEPDNYLSIWSPIKKKLKILGMKATFVEYYKLWKYRKCPLCKQGQLVKNGTIHCYRCNKVFLYNPWLTTLPHTPAPKKRQLT